MADIVKSSHTKFEMMNEYFDVDYKMYLTSSIIKSYNYEHR